MNIFLTIFCVFGVLFSYEKNLESKEFDTFIYLRGNANEKISEGSFSLMTWNVCALPSIFPTIFGGVRPAEERVNEIARLIIDVNADIVCLQEAHDLSFSSLLFDKLKDIYPHFIFDIGRESPIQLNSGLLVISKFLIKELEYTLFNVADLGIQKAVKKGTFAFKVFSQEHPLAYIIATHLQPYKTEKDAFIRLNELKIAYNQLLKYKDELYPLIICGDFNLDRFPPEEVGSSLIRNMFIDSLIPHKSHEIPATCTNYLTYYHNNEDALPIDQYTGEPDESIDYCLILKKGKDFVFSTKIIPAYNNHQPQEATSDHHAIVTTFYPSNYTHSSPTTLINNL